MEPDDIVLVPMTREKAEQLGLEYAEMSNIRKMIDEAEVKDE